MTASKKRKSLKYDVEVAFIRGRFNELMGMRRKGMLTEKNQIARWMDGEFDAQDISDFQGKEDWAPRELVDALCAAFLIPEETLTSVKFVLPADTEKKRKRKLDNDGFKQAVKAYWDGLSHRLAVREVIEKDHLEEYYKNVDALAYRIKGEAQANIGWKLLSDWHDVHTEGFLLGFDEVGGGDNLISYPVAILGLFPVPDPWSRQFLKYNIKEDSLTSEEITTGLVKRETWYLSGLSYRRWHELAYQDALFLREALLTWARKNSDLDKLMIVAEGTTGYGERLLLALDFKPSLPKPKGKPARFSLNSRMADVVKKLRDPDVIERLKKVK